MRLNIVSVEASASEINQVPEITQLLRYFGDSLSKGSASAPQIRSDESDGIWDFIDGRGRDNPHLELVKDFVRQCRDFGDVETIPGTSSRTPDGLNTYLMLKHTNHKYGAFAYVTPSSGAVGLRLDRKDAEECEYAIAGASKDRYQVRVNLNSAEAVAEAVRLASEAYERVRG